jgi:hypothetical protein
VVIVGQTVARTSASRISRFLSGVQGSLCGARDN